jgi:hypothetical protein
MTTTYYIDAGSRYIPKSRAHYQEPFQNEVPHLAADNGKPNCNLRSQDDKRHGRSFRQVMDDYLANARATGRQKKRQRTGQYTNDDPLIKFLRQRISRLNYGVKVPDVGVRPELTAKKLIARYNDSRFGAALRNEQFLDHFDSRQTFYFWADHTASVSDILIMIDGDAGEDHGGGTTEGCWRFMGMVRDRLFPGLYLEPSTHGKGVHGYFIMEKRGMRADLVRQALKNLDRYLKNLAASVGADIACVEVKGLPPSIQYDGNGKITGITFGQFAKLPRGSGVLNTCKVKYGDIALLDPDEIKVETQPEQAVVKKAGSKLPIGSFDSRVVRQDTLDKMPELEKVASSLLRQWTGATSFKADRWTVTATDVAQFLALMLCIKPKPDDSLPVRAVGRLWEEVYLAGDFSRPWNHHRCKAIRDLLSRHGHIDWVDFRFQYLPERKGRCCRWHISLLLRSSLDSVMGETTVVDTAAPFPDGPHDFHTPKWFDFVLDRQRRWLAEAEKEVEMLIAA